MRKFTLAHTKKLLFTALILFAAILANAQYPVVATTSTSVDDDDDYHYVTIPAHSTGDLIIVFWSNAKEDDVYPKVPSGWTQLYRQRSSDYTRMAFYRVATGNSGGFSLKVDLGDDDDHVRSAHVVHVIQNGTYTGVPVAASNNTATSKYPNPNNLTTGFGVVSTLWIAAAHSAYDGSGTPSAPSNYSNLVTIATSSSSGSSSSHARMTTARRELDAASEDAGQFTLKNSVAWLANTVAIQGIGCLEPTITLGANPSVCQGATSANLTYSATTYSPTHYTINWDATAEGQGFVDVAWTALPSSPIVLTVPGAAAAATYNATLKVRSSADCESTTYDISVTVNALPAAPESEGDVDYCVGDTPDALEVTVGAGVTVDWFADATGGTALVTSTLTYSPSSPGTYYAEARNTTTGCKSATRTAVTLTENQLPVAGIDSDDLEVCAGQPTTLTATGGGVSWLWTNDQDEEFEETTESIEVTPLVTTTYTLVITDANGCVSAPVTETVVVSNTACFQNGFAPGNWDLQNSGSGDDGYIDDSEAPCLVSLVGPSNGSTEMTICVGEGELAFDWSFTPPACSGSGSITWHSDDQSTNNGSSGNTQTVNAPANLSAGDLIIVTLHYRRTVTLTGLDGFTQIRRESSGSNGDSRATVIALYKIATGTETSFTFTTTGNSDSNSRWVAVANRVTGHNGSDPIGNDNGNNSGSSSVNSITVTAINTTADNSVLVGALALRNDENISGPSGMTHVYTYDANSLTARKSYQVISTSGTTGNKTWSDLSNEEAAALLFVINPGTACTYAAYYTINGEEFELEGTSGSVEGVDVENGDIVGFKVVTSPNASSPAILSITNFDAEEGVGIDPGEIVGDDEVCVESTIELTNPDGEPGGIWSVDDEDIATIDQDGVLTGVSAGTVIVTYLVEGFCGENFTTFEVTVNALPEVSCPQGLTLCVDDDSYPLYGSGVYSGNGVEEANGNYETAPGGPSFVPQNGGYVFNPASVGPGVYTVTYTVTDEQTGCTNSCSFEVTVQGVVCPEDFTILLDDEPVLLEGLPVGGSFSGEGVVYDEDLDAYFFDPAELDADNYTVYYTASDSQGDCNSSCSFIVTVEGDPCANDEDGPVIGACGQSFIVELYPVTFGRTTVWRGYLNQQAILNTITDNCSTIGIDDITISQTVFSPQDWGVNNNITVTATDESGNTTGPCNITVVVRYPLYAGELDPFGTSSNFMDTQLDVLVYPNPTKGKFYMDIINLNNPRVTAVVYNTTGAVVMVKELVTDGRVDMDLTGKVSGMYLLRLIADDKEFMHKIIKE